MITVGTKTTTMLENSPRYVQSWCPLSPSSNLNDSVKRCPAEERVFDSCSSFASGFSSPPASLN